MQALYECFEVAVKTCLIVVVESAVAVYACRTRSRSLLAVILTELGWSETI